MFLCLSVSLFLANSHWMFHTLSCEREKRVNCVTQIENIDVLLLLLSFVMIERYCYCYCYDSLYHTEYIEIYAPVLCHFFVVQWQKFRAYPFLSIEMLLLLFRCMCNVCMRSRYFNVNRSASNSGEHSLLSSNDYFLICLWHAMVFTVLVSSFLYVLCCSPRIVHFHVFAFRR